MADIAPATEVKPLENLALKVKELDAVGRAIEYSVTMPNTVQYATLTVPQKLWLLKSGPLRACSIPMIFSIMVRAEELRRETGAKIDELSGDLYSTGEGRIALSNKAKIKIANATGRIEGVDFDIIEGPEISLTGYTGPELICTVTVYVTGFKHPLVLTQTLSEWYMPANPNWKNRPEHMLRLNTYAHACEFIFPGDNDDAPPTPEPTLKTVAEVFASIAPQEQK